MALKAKAYKYTTVRRRPRPEWKQTWKAAAVETSWPLLIVNDTLSVYVQAYVYVNVDDSATVNSCCCCRPSPAGLEVTRDAPSDDLDLWRPAAAAGDELFATLPFKRLTHQAPDGHEGVPRMR